MSHVAKRPTLTVLIPARTGMNLGPTLCGVLDQGVPGVELLVVDLSDAQAVAAEVGRHRREGVRRLACPQATPGAGLNQALRVARGAWVGVLAEGEVYEPGALVQVMERLGEGVEWLVGECEGWDEEGLAVSLPRTREPADFGDFLAEQGGHLPMASGFVDRELLERLGGFDEGLELAWDHELVCRLLSTGASPRVCRLAWTVLPVGDRRGGCPVTRETERTWVARRYARHLPESRRRALEAQCDRREAVLARAQTESRSDSERRRVWARVLSGGVWLGEDVGWRRAA